jgi:hypothetical protein
LSSKPLANIIIIPRLTVNHSAGNQDAWQVVSVTVITVHIVALKKYIRDIIVNAAGWLAATALNPSLLNTLGRVPLLLLVVQILMGIFQNAKLLHLVPMFAPRSKHLVDIILIVAVLSPAKILAKICTEKIV